MTPEAIIAAIRKAVKEEREACAKMCEQAVQEIEAMPDVDGKKFMSTPEGGSGLFIACCLADAIRARKP